MSATDHAHDDHGHHEQQNFFLKYFWSTDHKIIAQQYMWTGVFMALIGGFLAYAFRMQLAFPGKFIPRLRLHVVAGIQWLRSRTTAPS